MISLESLGIADLINDAMAPQYGLAMGAVATTTDAAAAVAVTGTDDFIDYTFNVDEATDEEGADEEDTDVNGYYDKFNSPISVSPVCQVAGDILTYFTIREHRGAGSFGKVVVAQPTTAGYELLKMKGIIHYPKYVAIKQLPNTNASRKNFVTESGYMINVSAAKLKYAVKYYGCLEIHRGVVMSDYYIVMQYFPGKPLFARHYHAGECVYIATELANAINELHMFGLAHRDIHSGNALYSSELKMLKLVDYGLARPADKESINFDWERYSILVSNLLDKPFRSMSYEEALTLLTSK